MPTPDKEVRWVLLAQGHDRDALEQLLRSALPSLQRYLGHLIGPEHVDDISQDDSIAWIGYAGASSWQW